MLIIHSWGEKWPKPKMAKH